MAKKPRISDGRTGFLFPGKEGSEAQATLSIGMFSIVILTNALFGVKVMKNSFRITFFARRQKTNLRFRSPSSTHPWRTPES
jgi:hypothetical protein